MLTAAPDTVGHQENGHIYQLSPPDCTFHHFLIIIMSSSRILEGRRGTPTASRGAKHAVRKHFQLETQG
jgi:hypothetical protein